MFSRYSRRESLPGKLLERWLEGARWRGGGGAIRDVYFRSWHHHACRSPDHLIEEASQAACRSCTEQVQFSDAETHVLDQSVPMVGEGSISLPLAEHAPLG
jgi:hypothetical protein